MDDESESIEPESTQSASTQSDSTQPELPPARDLQEALTRRGIELAPAVVDRLTKYCTLLWSWNEKLNLTRHTTFDKFAGRDVVDTLALSALIEPNQRVLDLGTGGGVPGIVLAIVREDLKVVLLDSVAKKAHAVEEMVRELGLSTPVICAGAQQHLADVSYDVVTIRAVASLTKLLTWTRPHRRSFGRLLVIKGPKWVDERGEARHRHLLDGMRLRKIASYPLEGTSSESVILDIRADY